MGLEKYPNKQLNDKIGNLSKNIFNVLTYGADPTGVNDSTQAFINAFSAANNLKFVGLVSTILLPGATVKIPEGTYNLSSLSSPIDVNCNVDCHFADVLVPASYASSVFRVGLNVSGSILSSAKIELPKVRKPGGSAIVAGSIGIETINLSTSRLTTRGVEYFESAVYLTGYNQGTVYCDIHIGQIMQCKRAIVLVSGAGGWVNTNRITGGSISQSPSYAGGARAAGWRHILIDGRSQASVIGNTFFGLSLEGNASEYLVEAYNAYENTFLSCYHESGATNQSVTLSGVNFTQTNHGLVVGDLVAFNATTTPGGMVLSAPYYVVNVPDANTFQVSQNKGGSAITFSSNGAGVTYALSNRCYFDNGGGNTFFNRFEYVLTPPSTFIDIIEANGAWGNGRKDYQHESLDLYVAEDLPIFRVRNQANSATSRPAYAAYAPSVNPNNQPSMYNTAMGDQGFYWRNNGADTGRLDNVSGTLNYYTSGGVITQIPSCNRSSSITNISSLSLAANAMTSFDISLSGAALNDHVVVTPLGALPAGVIYSHAFVLSAGTIRMYFYNTTASAVNLSIGVEAIAFKRFI